MISLFITFLLAHVLGDFVLQPNSWVAHKQRYKIKSKYLYIHTALHFLLLCLVTRFNTAYIPIIIFITVMHGAIDSLKLYVQNKRTAKNWFFIDQILHLLVLLISVQYLCSFSFLRIISVVYDPKVLAFITAFLLATYVTAIIQKVLLSRWMIQLKPAHDKPSNNAGMYIGLLERSFVFLFVILNFWSGIGFILAAKSIFRIGDLTRAKDVAVTEYILIGTFLSFGFGILFGLLYKYCLPFLNL